MDQPKKVRILVVDDDALVRKSVVRFLSPQYDVESAENGRKALSMLREGRYDAVVSDVNMPVMDGQDMFTEAVRGGMLGIDQFLFMTGLPGSPQAQALTRAGARVVERGMSPLMVRALVEGMTRGR